MSKPLILFPFGGNAREALTMILSTPALKKAWDVVGFIDDDQSRWKKDLCGVKVLGGKDILKKFPKAFVLAVAGNPQNYLKRQEIIEILDIKKSRWATIIHPSVAIASNAKIGVNSLLMPNVVVGCGSLVGDHAVMLPNTTIGHETTIGNYCCIGSNVAIAGSVKIADNCYIGSGSSIRDGILIGEGSLIGLKEWQYSQ